MRARPSTLVLLLLAVVVTGWVALGLRQRPVVDDFVGPPRPGYSLDQYELVVLDREGRESVSLIGPLLVRDAETGMTDLLQPRFTLPSESGEWTARSGLGRLNASGDELRLTRDVRIDGPPDGPNANLRFRSEELTVLPEAQWVTSQAAVSIEQGPSIILGQGLEVELDTRRFRTTQSRITHDPSR